MLSANSWLAVVPTVRHSVQPCYEVTPWRPFLLQALSTSTMLHSISLRGSCINRFYLLLVTISIIVRLSSHSVGTCLRMSKRKATHEEYLVSFVVRRNFCYKLCIMCVKTSVQANISMKKLREIILDKSSYNSRETKLHNITITII